MHYLGSHETINWLFILACLSVLQWILTICIVAKNYLKLGNKIDTDTFGFAKNYIAKIPFAKDYFYIFWNIYPIILYAFFYYLDTSWENYLNQIVMIYGDNAKLVYGTWFNTFTVSGYKIDYKYIDIFVIFISITLAFRATFITQIKKQKQFIREDKKIYWWDIRLNKKLFWIRFIFLFFNFILIVFISYIGIKVVLFIINLLSLNVTINPFHPDGYGGLRVLMEISSIILAIYLLLATMGIVGFLDHKNIKDKSQFLGDLYNTSYLFLSIGYMGYFIYKIDDILGRVDISSLLSHSLYKSYSVCPDINISATSKVVCNELNSSTIAQISSDIGSIYGNLINFNKFPIDLSLFSSSLFTFVFPLAMWFIFNFLE